MKKVLFVISAVCLLIVCNVSLATSYNAYDDFYYDVNPPGNGWTGNTTPNSWSYYAGNVNGTPFGTQVGSTYLSTGAGNLYGISSGGSVEGPGAYYNTGPGYLAAYTDDQGWGMSIGKYDQGWYAGNPGGTPFDNTLAGNKYLWLQPSTTGDNPASDGLAAVLNWTAPAAGKYWFHGAFLAGSNAPNETISFAIMDSLLGTNVARTVVNQGSGPYAYNFYLTLSAGDVVQWQVGNNGLTGAPMGLRAEVSAVPEPSTALLFGLGGLIMYKVGRRYKARKGMAVS